MDNLLAFIIGSSIVLFFITFLYVGYFYKLAGRPDDVPYELMVLFIPMMYGIFNVINVNLQKRYNLGPNVSLIVGGMLGLTFSTIGQSINLPTKIFNFTPETKYYVHFIAPVLYALIFRFTAQPLNNKYILKK